MQRARPQEATGPHHRLERAVLVQHTPGFTSADIANIMNEGALLAARGSREITQTDLEMVLDRVVAGSPERRSRNLG